MADPVKVESLRFHTYDGVDRPAGTAYDADAAYVETLEATGMARRVPAAAPTPPPPDPPKTKKR